MAAIEKVLLVDDEPDIRLIAQISLAEIGGWQVLTASSGREGVLLARREQPDLVLLDVMMPGMDGFATLEELRRDGTTANIPVVFMTAKAQPREIDEYYERGATGVVVKPFDPLTLPDDLCRIVADRAGTP